MKLQFKHQRFQEDAAKAVCDVFAGQPYKTLDYRMDRGTSPDNQMEMKQESVGWGNQQLVPQLHAGIILNNLIKVQRINQIEPSMELEGHYNLTVEMETGVGKTYTYIKTIYELNQRYGFSKFIVVVPSVAIREGVYKSFEITQEHFTEEYGKKIQYFIYDSFQLMEIDQFASDSSIHVMIINSQAFNARGRDARRIYMKLDSFRSRRPIDVIAKTNPILIIDEPQSVEGAAAKERLEEFNPLITLRYSATHKKDSLYNMVYRLDAVEAYHKKLVKKIAVKGISVTGSTAAEGYVYLESLSLSKGSPGAVIEFDRKGADGIRKIIRTARKGYKLYENSGELEEYRDGYTVIRIDGRDSSVEFANGIKLFAGDVIGAVSEEQLRRIQIRETILTHLERERQLIDRGIKVLSLFFIDEVAKYKQYDDSGNTCNGIYADIFEEEYKQIIDNLQLETGEEGYRQYISSIQAHSTHAGYFSIDKNRQTGAERFIDSKLGNRKDRTSDDCYAYNLIMKNKERLLDYKEPVRFIFSHSALREGWDNPNVFQICTLKQSSSEVRKRQEVGRGLRLCVNQAGERMDENVLGEEVHSINVLTVIANESYDSFAKGLQEEFAEAAALDSDCGRRFIPPDNARTSNVELKIDMEKLRSHTFQNLWEQIRIRSAYRVEFDSRELIEQSIAALNKDLRVSAIFFKVETGIMTDRKGREEQQGDISFVKKSSARHTIEAVSNHRIKYDLIGNIATKTKLTRNAAVQILQGIEGSVFNQFKDNPEEFIIKASNLINDEKAKLMIKKIVYDKLEEVYDTSIFTGPVWKGCLGVNAMAAKKHLYDHILYDCVNEREFAEKLDISEEVAVYVKLPKGFYITTPVGRYTPDWAIAFHEVNGRQICFVVETKGSINSMQLRFAEKAKIHCAREHFKAISTGNIVYEVVDSMDCLMIALKGAAGRE